jgi:hypothetical protein
MGGNNGMILRHGPAATGTDHERDGWKPFRGAVQEGSRGGDDGGFGACWMVSVAVKVP